MLQGQQGSSSTLSSAFLDAKLPGAEGLEMNEEADGAEGLIFRFSS